MLPLQSLPLSSNSEHRLNGVSLPTIGRRLLCAFAVLSLPNMFAARARHGIGRFLLSQLLFADWAGFSHQIRHTLTSHLGYIIGSYTMHLAYQNILCLSNWTSPKLLTHGRSLDPRATLLAHNRLCAHRVGGETITDTKLVLKIRRRAGMRGRA